MNMKDQTEESPSERTERIVKELFSKRPNWSVTKLDTGKSKAADFKICGMDFCFLCEVKTIASARANFPYRPIDYFLEEREKRQEIISRSQSQNPETRIVMPPDDYEFTFGDPIVFNQKYRNLPRFTERYFMEFVDELTDFLINRSRIKDLPYSIRIDSDDLFIPFGDERKQFFEWLENDVLAIHQGKPRWDWHDNRLPHTKSYHTFKTMKAFPNGIKFEYQINVEKLNVDLPLQVNVYYYGGLNEDAIIQEIEKAAAQLEASDKKEKDRQIARIIALAFSTSLGFEEGQLFKLLVQQLKEYSRVSAVALLTWTPEKILIQREDQDILSWLTETVQVNYIAGFFVIHNPWLSSQVNHLNLDAFDIKGSVQISPVELRHMDH